MAHPPLSGDSPPRFLNDHVHLDGRTLEGGGQLMRNALALSALTGRAVTVDHVRGNRKGKTGLRPSHSAAVKLLAKISGSKVDGDQVASHSVTFSPPTAGITSCQNKETVLIPLQNVAVQTEYNINLSSPGSVCLIFQALYPYLLYVGSRAASNCIELTIQGGTNGTDSPSYDYATQVIAPNFARLGLPPLSMTLHKRGWSVGRTEVGSVTFSIHPLASAGPEADVENLKLSRQSETTQVETMVAGACFPHINIMDYERGKIASIDVTVLAPDMVFTQERTSGTSTIRKFVERQTRRALRKALQALDPKIFETPSDSLSDDRAEDGACIPIQVHTSEPTSTTSRLYILLVAHTSTGFRIGYDCLLGKDLNSKKGKKGQNPHSKSGRDKTSVEIVADLIDECIHGFMRELVDPPVLGSNPDPKAVSRKRSCLDQHMRDQIVVFEALGKLHGNKTETGSQVLEDERYWSLHTQTAKWVCSKMLEGSHRKARVDTEDESANLGR